MSSSSLICSASESRFWVFWIRNTIRNVTIVVLVLMTSCQVSLKWKIGPVTAHTAMTAPASTNAEGWPVACDVALAKLVNHDEDLVGLMSDLRVGNGRTGRLDRRGRRGTTSRQEPLGGRGVDRCPGGHQFHRPETAIS